MKKKALILIFIIFILIYALSKISNIEIALLDFFKSYRHDLKEFTNTSYISAVFIYLLTYIFISFLPLPGDTTLTIMGGFLFGPYLGLLYSILAILISGILTFLSIKNLNFYKNEYQKFKYKTEFEASFKKYGIGFLLLIRILPILPVSAANLISSFMPISLFTFSWITAIGMLPIIGIYSFAGTEINKINSLWQIIFLPIFLILITICLLVFSKYIFKLIRKKLLKTEKRKGIK